MFSCQKVKENKLIKAKGAKLQIQGKPQKIGFILKEDYGVFMLIRQIQMPF